MSSYTSFAIVGFGAVGSLLATEFVQSKNADKYKLRVLTRSTDKPELKALVIEGVSVIPVDYSSQESIAKALESVEVVFSALRDDGLDIQTKVIRAAKDADIKLFVPSEYGRNTIGEKSDYLGVKAEAHELLKELRIPYTLFFTGIWPELLLPNAIGPHIGIDFAAGKFQLFGDGKLPQSYTSPTSFIPFVHRLITSLPPSQLENKSFEIEGDRKSFRDLIALWEAKHSRPAEVTERSPEEIQMFVDQQTSPLFKWIAGAYKNGDMLVSGEANKLWPEWKPLTWEDMMP